jgi:hypothetical protein
MNRYSNKRNGPSGGGAISIGRDMLGDDPRLRADEALQSRVEYPKNPEKKTGKVPSGHAGGQRP